MIATGYNLPFRVTHSDVAILSGRPVSIRVRTRVSDDANLVSGAMQLFTQIAITGALGGEHLAPWDTAFLVAARPSINRRDFLFHANPCSLAAEAWVVLSHFLLKVHQSMPIEMVEILAHGDTSPVTMMESDRFDSTYPGAYPHLPFVLNNLEPEGGGYSLFIALASPLTRENEATLNGWLEAWTQTILHGGYSLAPIDPASNYVEPYGDGIDAYDTTVEWAVFKLRADPVAAINALINLFSCFHVRCQPIQSIEIG